MVNFQALKELIANTEADAVKFFEKGNKAAGTRVRKNMQDIKKYAQAVRIDVQSQKTEDGAE